VPEPVGEAGVVFLLHCDQFHTHAVLRFAPLHHGAGADLACGGFKQQLDKSASRRGLACSNT